MNISRRMFSQKADFAGEKVGFRLVGQIVSWNHEKNFGFIHTPDDSYYCHGSGFQNQCREKDIVKFDVWENFKNQSQKAVNVCFMEPGTSVIGTNKIGTMTKWFYASQKGVVCGSDGKEYRCSVEDFEQGDFPRGSRVCFDIIKDNWNSTETRAVCRAVNIRNAKIARHVHLAGVEGQVVKLARSHGFVSTKLCDQDIYFNERELTRLHMQEVRHRDRITFDVIMEENGSLTAENINMHIDVAKSRQQLAKTRQLVAEARHMVADFSSGKKVLAVDDAVKNVSAAQEDDCASTAASDYWNAPTGGAEDEWSAPACVGSEDW